MKTLIKLALVCGLLIASFVPSGMMPGGFLKPTVARACSPLVSWTNYSPYFYYSGGNKYIAADFNYSCFDGFTWVVGRFQKTGVDDYIAGPPENGSGTVTILHSFATDGITWSVTGCFDYAQNMYGPVCVTSTRTIVTQG